MVTMQQNTVSSQIIVFETLQEFTQFVDNTIQLHKSELSRYEDELGLMLRQAGQDSAEAEWAKEMQNKLTPQEKQTPKTNDKKDEKKEKGKEKMKEKNDMKERKEKKREEKAKKGSTNWRIYKDVQIFAGVASQGRTELYFEAVNELKATLEKLGRMKETLTQLTGIGLSSVLYLAYIKNGMPEKLVLLPQAKQEEGKFEFKADFVTENIEPPIESREV